MRALQYESETVNDTERYLRLTPMNEILSSIESHFAEYIPEIERIRADLAFERISAEDVASPFDIPSRAISAMDGYAVRFSDLRNASTQNPKLLIVRGSIYPAHSSKLLRVRSGETYYVATGAPLPVGTDAVVPVEKTLRQGRKITVRHTIPKSKNVAKKGEDIHKGQDVIRKGQVLNSTDVAALIGVGRPSIRVYKIPVVGLLSVGNELREFNPMHRERKRNYRYTINNYLNLLSGYVEQFGSRAVSLGTCSDDKAQIQRSVLSGAKKCDMVFTIGGSSVGSRDNVIAALQGLQGKILFHGVRVVPIRPAGVVIVQGHPVVLVPGHAVSALLTFFAIALPILNMIAGLMPRSRRAMINVQTKNEITNERAIDAISLVRLESKIDGSYKASPLRWGSNLLSNLMEADGFVWLSPRQTIAKNQFASVQLFTERPMAKSVWSSSFH